jgi:hypothetical protein
MAGERGMRLLRVVQAVLCAATLVAFDASAGAPAAWYHGTTIKYLYAGHVGNRAAVQVNAAVNFGDCGGWGEMNLDPANPHFKSILAILMSAYLTGRAVSVYTDGTCRNGGVSLTDVILGTYP